MNKFGIKNYEDFKEVFAMKEGNNGMYRKNKVLLAALTDKKFHKFLNNPDVLSRSGKRRLSELRDTFLSQRDMTGLFPCIDGILRLYLSGKYLCSSDVSYVHLLHCDYISPTYRSDNYNGVCEDGDVTAYRYVRRDNDRVFKMKVSRMYRSFLNDAFGDNLCDTVKNYMCEEIAQQWEAYVSELMPKCTLHVDDNFKEIYNGTRKCKGDFHSCMSGGDHSSFYRDAVEAKAAYLTDEEGFIVARCVIFTNVTDENGKVYRLAERQYSTDCNDALKNILVNSLIKGGYIDGYKKVGAGCSEPTAFLDIEGNSLSHHEFSISCELDSGDIMSYQDTFKYYDVDERRAYNTDGDGHWDENLSETDYEFQGGNWDSYHEYYTSNDVIEVYVHGCEETCDEDNLDDFIYVDSVYEYHHEEDVSQCEQCGEYYVTDDGHYSSVTGEDYCCVSCMEEAEREYMEINWYYCDYDDEYVENSEDCIEVYTKGVAGWETTTMTYHTFKRMCNEGELVEKDGKWYIKDDVEEGDFAEEQLAIA